MKYICRDCGLIYTRRPRFCECGSDDFSIEVEEETHPRRKPQSAGQHNNYAPQTQHPKRTAKRVEEKAKEKASEEDSDEANPLVVLIVFIFVALIAYYVPIAIKNKADAENKKAANSAEATYLYRMMQDILTDFNPSGITKTDYCIVSFEINENGGINKRYFERRSAVPELNNKVMYSLQKTTIVEEPPQKFANVPLSLKVDCTANEQQAECKSNLYRSVTAE